MVPQAGTRAAPLTPTRLLLLRLVADVVAASLRVVGCWGPPQELALGRMFATLDLNADGAVDCETPTALPVGIRCAVYSGAMITWSEYARLLVAAQIQSSVRRRGRRSQSRCRSWRRSWRRCW